ncbi:MAG: DUF502 domain-containing protein [Candidatus Sumerlaeia bacterium]
MGKKLKDHVKRRLLIGLVVFAPFGLTIFVLIKLVAFGKEGMTKPMVSLLLWLRENFFTISLQRFYNEDGNLLWWIDFILLFVSIFLVVLFLYFIGLLSATFFGRRYISLGEKALHRVPGAMFVYNTIKQLAEILSRPKSNAFKKVVLVEYPRTDVWALAFFTGVTYLDKNKEIRLNVFLPSTPNPTTGFLLLLKPEEVLLTNLTVSQASRFIFSFGVVEIDKLSCGPFPPAEYLEPSAALVEEKDTVSKETPSATFFKNLKENLNKDVRELGRTKGSKKINPKGNDQKESDAS